MEVQDMIDFYLAHRNEKIDIENSFYIKYTASQLLELKDEWDEYQKQKYYYDMYMEDFDEYGEEDEDVEDYISPYLALPEYSYNEYLEKLNPFFEDKTFVQQLKNGERKYLTTYEYNTQGKMDDDLFDKFNRRRLRNMKMKTKLRKVDSVSLYRSDFEAINKAKKEFNLTELQVMVCFGLIFMSRMNNVKFCRIGTEFKSKGFWAAFDKHIPLEDRQRVWETGLFKLYHTDKAKARKQLDKHYDEGFAKYLNIKDEDDVIYLNFDKQDEIVWTYNTTIENNRLNFSQLCREAMPDLKYRYCTVCNELFLPNNNKQKQCTECKEKYKKEQARLRKQKSRAIQKGTLPKEAKKKKLNDEEFFKQYVYEQSIEKQKELEEEMLTMKNEKPWLLC